MIKEFKSSKGDFLALLLPSDFDELGAIEKMIDGERFVSYYNDHEKEDIWIKIPNGEYEIIGLESEITENMAKNIVSIYEQELHPCRSNSFLNTFKALMGIINLTEDNWVLIKKLV